MAYYDPSQPQNPGRRTNQQNSGNPTFQQSQQDAQYNQQLGSWQQRQPAPQPAPAQQASAPDNGGGVDPFAASGGGTFQNGGWVPNNNPASQGYMTAQAPQGQSQQPQGGYGAQPYGYVAQSQPQAPMPLPQYQTYNYHQENIAPTTSTPTIGPSDLFQYSGQAQQPNFGLGSDAVNPALGNNLTALLTQLGGGQQGSGMMAGAYGLANQAAAGAVPDTAGLKESQKDTLLALQKQLGAQIDQSAAQRGVGQGGNVDAQHLALGDQFAQNLTGAYRNIDTAAQQQAFENQLKASSQLAGLTGQDVGQQLQANQALQGLDAQKFSQNLAGSQARAGFQNQDFGQQLAGLQANNQFKNQDFSNLLAGQNQAFNQQLQGAQFGLQGQQAQADEMARKNAFNLSEAGLGQSGSQFDQTLGLNREQAALAEYIQRQAAQQNQQQIGNQYSLGQGQLDLSKYLGNQSNALQQAQLAQQGSQFDRNLAQQGSQFGQTMDYNGNLAASNQNAGLIQAIIDAWSQQGGK